MCDFQLRKVITSSSEFNFGVLGLHGKPIESSFQPDAFGGHWVPEMVGKGRLGKSGRLPG